MYQLGVKYPLKSSSVSLSTAVCHYWYTCVINILSWLIDFIYNFDCNQSLSDIHVLSCDYLTNCIDTYLPYTFPYTFEY